MNMENIYFGEFLIDVIVISKGIFIFLCLEIEIEVMYI